MLCCCWCFCTSDAFHSKIRNDSSDQVCVPAYLCIYIYRERERCASIYIYISLSVYSLIYLRIYVFVLFFILCIYLYKPSACPLPIECLYLKMVASSIDGF